MGKQKTRKERIKQKLTHKYRLVILNEDTFQERFSMKLSRLNVFVVSGVFSVLLIALTTVLIAFTSLKEYIPGYSSARLKRKATKLVYQADSLKYKVMVLEAYTQALRPVLTGEIKPEKFDSVHKSKIVEIDESKLDATDQEKQFREDFKSKDRFPIQPGAKEKTKNVFFAPLIGSVTQNFNVKDKHFAIDIVAKKGTPVKSIADGTVILSEWTAETGYVITIQHANGFLSVYKHNGNLMKEQGQQVKSGEVIASVGSTGEHTTGPHLHFELWKKGFPVNPKDYINFQ